MRDWARREWFDFTVGAVVIVLFVPAGECCEEEEADERKNNGDDSEIGSQLTLDGKNDQVEKPTLSRERRYYP